MAKKHSALATKFRAVAGSLQTSIAALESTLEEPLKSKFAANKAEIAVLLAGLPDPEDEDESASVESAAKLLTAMQSHCANVEASNKTAIDTLASTKASIPGQITAAIDAKITAGDLIPKDKHATAITDATSAATTAARTSAIAELGKVSARKTILATASLPIPADEVLTGEDKDFDAKKTTAIARAAELKPFGVTAERCLALCWSTEEVSYQTTLSVMKDAWKAATGHKGVNPFAGGPATGNTAPAKKIGGLC